MASLSALSDGGRRVSHLWQLAVGCAGKNPLLAKFYLSEINSSPNDDSSAAFALKYCQHCFALFTAHNCCVRVLPKRGKNKKQKQEKNRKKEKKDNHKKQDEILKLPRRLNHVTVFCKTCGKRSFCTGIPRSRSNPMSKTRDSSSRTPNQCNSNLTVFSTAQSNNMDQGSTPNVSKSGKKRKRRHNSKLKGILLADEQQNSKSTVASPRLLDFLSSL